MALRSFCNWDFQNYLKTIFLIFLGMCINLSVDAQDWEVVKTIEFENSSDFTPPTSYSLGFIQAPYGADGSFNNHCALNNSFSNNEGISMPVDLIAGTVYQLRLNTKTNNDGSIWANRVDFVLGTASNPFIGQMIESDVTIPYVSSFTDSGIEIITPTFTVASSGTYYLSTVYFAGLSNTWVRIDNYTLEQEVPTNPIPTFTLTDQSSGETISEITLAPGESASLCLAPDEAPTALIETNISITGETSPHFTNYTNQQLNFIAGSVTQQCFTIEPSTDITEGNYTFEVKDDDDNIIASFIVNVVPECEGYAGISREICMGETVTLGCPDNPDELCYKWVPDEDGEDGVSDAAAPNPTATPNSTTTYMVYVSDDQGNIEIDQITITVKESPEVSIDAVPSPPIIVNNTPVVLDAGSEYLPEAYTWKRDGMSIPGGDEVTSIVADLPGTYTVEVTNTNNCTASASIDVIDGNNEEDCSDALKDYFRDNGFYELAIDITSEDVGLRSFTTCDVQDEAQLLISISDDQPENFANNISNLYESPDGFLDEITGDIKAFVTKDDNFCKNIVQTSDCGITDISVAHVESTIGAAELGHWAHISGDVGESGTMFLSGKTPSLDVTWSTQDPKTKDLLEKTKQHYENFLQPPFTAERPTTLLMVTGAFVTQPCDDPNTTESSSDTEPCPNQNNDDLICLSPAGIPVRLESGATVRFGVVDKYKTEIDPRALVGFTILDSGSSDRGIYYGATKPSVDPHKFFGYYNIYTEEYYETSPPVTSTEEITLGIRGEGQSCDVFDIHRVEFTPNTSFPGASGIKAAGPHVSDFDAAPIGTFGNKVDGSQELISLCLPNVTFENFDKPLYVILDQDNPSNVDNPNDDIGPIGWIFYVAQEGGGIAKYHATYDEANPEELKYQLWSPCQGVWLDTPPPAEETQMPFLSALMDALLESGHMSLDIVGLIPVIGEPADFVNGVWYALEGDATNAAFSFAGTTPVVGAASTTLKYTFKVVISGVGTAADKTVELSKYIIKYVDETGAAKILKVGPPGNQTEKVGEWVGLATYDKGFSGDQAKRFANWFLKNKDFDLIKTIGENENLLDAWKSLDEAGGTVDDAQRLFSKIAKDGSGVLLDFFKNNPNKVKGWKLLSDLYPNPTHKRLWDTDLVESVANALDDTEFMGVLATYTDDAVETLSNIITKNYKAVCCGDVLNAANIHLSPINNYLDNVNSLLKSMESNNIDGIMGLIGNITSNNLNLIDEGNQLARLSGSQPPNPAFNMDLYQAFNKTFETSSKRFDLKGVPTPSNGNTFSELKSWGNVIADNPNAISDRLKGNSSYGQYTEYLNNVDELEHLRYSFDVGKISPQVTDYPNLPLAERQVRVVWDQWKIFYNDKAASLLDDLGEIKFMELFGVDNTSDFLDIVNTPISDIANAPDLYKYIKIE